MAAAPLPSASVIIGVAVNGGRRPRRDEACHQACHHEARRTQLLDRGKRPTAELRSAQAGGRPGSSSRRPRFFLVVDGFARQKTAAESTIEEPSGESVLLLDTLPTSLTRPASPPSRGSQTRQHQYARHSTSSVA